MERGLRELAEEMLGITPSVLGAFLSSSIIGYFRSYIMENPWILGLNPPLRGLNGNIYSSMVSRMSSRLHMGTMSPRLRQQAVYAGVLVAAATALVSASIITGIVWLGAGGDPGRVFYTAYSAMLLVLILLYPLSVIFSIHSFRRGLSPDSVVIPLVLLLGDVLTTPFVIYSSMVSRGMSAIETGASIALMLAAFTALIALSYRVREEETLRVLGESQGVLLATLLIGSAAGLVLASNARLLASKPYLIVTATVFNGATGGMASLYAGKLSTMMHLGQTRPGLTRDKLPILLRMALLSLYTYSLLAATGYAVATLVAGDPGTGFLRAYIFTLTAGYTLLPPIWLLTQLLSIISFRLGLDPDNVMIPILTTTIDLAGSITYIAYAHILIAT